MVPRGDDITMKRLKTGVINTLSFVKLSSFTVNSFDVTLDKVVGTGSLTITNLTDLNNLDSCKDFIQLNVDLINNELEGGEYELTITNSGDSYKYLTEVQDYQYNNLTTGIYSDSVVLSNQVDAEAPSEQQPNGSDGTVSFDIELRDDVYGTMSSPYYVRNTYFIQAIASAIHNSITQIKTTLTDSSGNEVSNIVNVDDFNFEPLLLVFNDEPINYGDVASFVYEGLDSNASVVYTSDTYTAIIPPKIELYIADSLSSANDMKLNGISGFDILNGDTTTYNLYVYLESNTSAQITINNSTAVNDKVFNNAITGSLLGTSPFTISPTEGAMELVSSDIIPSWTSSVSERSVRYYSIFNWTGGYTTPLLNNIPNFYNFNHYGISSNQVTQRPYPKETLTIAGTTFTLEGFSPILYNSLTSYATPPNDTLSLYMGDGTYQINTNNVNSIAVQQQYSDNSTEETIITEAQLDGGQIFPAMQGDLWDVVAYVSRINSSKTLVHTKVWVKYGSYWFNVDNNSIDYPHFLLER